MELIVAEGFTGVEEVGVCPAVVCEEDGVWVGGVCWHGWFHGVRGYGFSSIPHGFDLGHEYGV